MMKKLLPLAASAAFCLLLTAPRAWATTIERPDLYFNVYSLGNIGTSTNPYTSDFEGLGGSAGSAFFRDFGVHFAEPRSTYSFFSGSAVSLAHGIFKNGGVEAYGNVFLDYFYSDGNISSGGTVSVASRPDFGGDPALAGGSVKGNIYARNGVNLTYMYSSGNVRVRTGGTMNITADANIAGGSAFTAKDFTPTVDHAAVSEFFLDKSAAIGAMADTTTFTAYPDHPGDPDSTLMLVIEVKSGVNVVTIDAATLAKTWGVEVRGPRDATLYVNVPDASAEFQTVLWWGKQGFSIDTILVNFPNATTVTFSGFHDEDLLMPLADATFSTGLVKGLLVTGNLYGGGQVGLDVSPIPEPATALLFLSGGAVLAVRRYRARAR